MKKSIKKVVSVLCAVIMMMSMLTACGGNDTSEVPPAATDTESEASSDAAGSTEEITQTDASYKDEIHIAVNAAPANLDLFTSTAMQAQWMCTGTVFESLVTIDSAYNIHPELAEVFEISDDAMTYTYTLREGVNFHDGTVMTAEDVVASLNHWIEMFSDAAIVCGDSRFTVTDDGKVTITLPTPYLYLNELMVKGSQRAIIVPASVIERADPETGIITEYIGTGPYKFGEWETDRYILFTKFDDYCPYGTSGDLDGYYGYKEALTANIYYDIVTDAATRAAGIQTGEYDFVFSLNIDDYSMFNGNSDYQIFTESTNQLLMVYNKKTGIASDAAIRRAVNTALNCDDILRAAYVEDEFVIPGGTLMLMKDSSWYSEIGTEYYNQNDPEKAAELLAEAGYNGEEFNILVSNSYSDFYNAALVIQQNLEAAGVNVVLNVVDWATYQTLSRDETAFDAYITSCSMKSIPTQLYYLGESAGWATDDETLVALKDAINTSTDAEAAYAALEDLQEYCLTDYMPASILGVKSSYSVATNKVKNMYYFEGPHPWSVTVEE